MGVQTESRPPRVYCHLELQDGDYFTKPVDLTDLSQSVGLLKRSFVKVSKTASGYVLERSLRRGWSSLRRHTGVSSGVQYVCRVSVKDRGGVSGVVDTT